MKVDTMRAIDHWVGIPLCFLATVGLWLSGRLRPRTQVPRRILFVELSEMGSTILADPAMRKAARLFGAELFFVIFRSNVASLALLKTVPEANIYTIRADRLTHLASDTLGFLRWTRAKRIDSVIDLELFSRFTALLTGLSGAAHRVGFHRFHGEGLYRGEMLSHAVAYNPHIHIAKNFIALVNALAAAAPELPYSKTCISDDELTLAQVTVPEEGRTAMRQRIAEIYPAYDSARHRIVLLNPNASELLPQRRWPQENFAALARALLGSWDDLLILITGAPDEAAEAEQLRGMVAHPRMINFAGRQQLAELPWLYALSAAMITNDSGPGHFAGVTGLPTVVLFGPETPALYGPLGRGHAISAGLACSPCVSAANHRKTPCRDPVCMRAITPEQVFAAVHSLLEK
ncbi:MAG TPA: glycosyltransferase family 9 protein [Rhodospirillaceae bacterium]|nr:glycosyltransferase family 9 protein [Rhodospirillaceae bacterium]